MLKRKLIYSFVILGFVFLTGGIKYQYTDFDDKKELIQDHLRTSYKYQKEIRILGFYYQEFGDGLWEYGDSKNVSDKRFPNSTFYGWGLRPSLKIISITKAKTK
jgi:hypothetical protein